MGGREYNVIHKPGCWGYEQSEETDWEIIHCPCCEDQWLKVDDE